MLSGNNSNKKRNNSGGMWNGVAWLFPASRDRRHYRNTITILDRGRFFLQVAHVVVIEVDIHKGPQFAFLGIKVAVQVWMFSSQAGQSLGDCASLNFHRRLLTSVLA